MFCPNCGAQLADEARFCGNCGSSIESAPRTAEGASPNPNPAEYYEGVPTAPVTPQPTPAKKKSALPIILIAGAVVVCVAIVLILVLSGGRGYKDYNDLIDDYFNAFGDYDTEAVLDLVPPCIFEFYGYNDGSLGALEDIDYWYDDGDYGHAIANWTITDFEYADSDEIQYANSVLNVNVETFYFISVTAYYTDGDYDYFDFELIVIDGRVYLAYVY